MPDRIVHIGFPKTATTFLQKNIYPFFQGIDYHDYKIADDLFYDLIYLDDLDYNPDKSMRLIDQYFETDKNTLFSFESLAGAPYLYKGVNRSLIPNRLKELGFTKVIISIRNQVDMVDSLYRQYVVQGGVMKFKDFLDLEENWKLSIRPFYLGYLNYQKLVAKYISVFGNENVHVIEQEHLRESSNQLVRNLKGFIGAKGFEKPDQIKSTNESLTNLSVNLLRFCNHFIFTSQKPNNLIWNKINTWFVRRVFAIILDPFLFRFVSSKRSYLKPEMTKILKKRFSEGNKELEKLIDRKLGSKYF